MFNFNLNPNSISTKAALMALASNAIESAKNIPHKLNSSKQDKALKARMSIVSELNEAEKVIADLVSRNVTGTELQIALEYANSLRAKLQ